MTIFDQIYAFLGSSVFPTAVPYADLLLTLSSGVLTLFAVALPFYVIYKGIGLFLGGR